MRVSLSELFSQAELQFCRLGSYDGFTYFIGQMRIVWGKVYENILQSESSK